MDKKQIMLAFINFCVSLFPFFMFLAGLSCSYTFSLIYIPSGNHATTLRILVLSSILSHRQYLD